MLGVAWESCFHSALQAAAFSFCACSQCFDCVRAGDEDDADALFPSLEQMNVPTKTITEESRLQIEQMGGMTNAGMKVSELQLDQHSTQGHVMSERKQKLAMLEQVLDDLGIEA